MASWQAQTAKAKFSELLRATRDKGPQTISVRGRDEFVILTKQQHDQIVRAGRPPETGLDLFRSIRKLDVDLDALIGARQSNGLREVSLFDEGSE
jgi:prevent-host-death family protein